MENFSNRNIYLIEFIIGFILVGIGLFVYLTVLFCRGFMQLYCDILFRAKSLDLYYGFFLSSIVLSIGLILIADEYLRFKRIRMIQIKVRNHLPLESVPAKISREKRSIIYISIYMIVLAVCGVLFRLLCW
jgi:hypothetical protein